MAREQPAQNACRRTCGRALPDDCCALAAATEPFLNDFSLLSPSLSFLSSSSASSSSSSFFLAAPFLLGLPSFSLPLFSASPSFGLSGVAAPRKKMPGLAAWVARPRC